MLFDPSSWDVFLDLSALLLILFNQLVGEV